MITVFKMDQCLELDDILSSIFASIEGSLPETLQVGKLRRYSPAVPLHAWLGREEGIDVRDESRRETVARPFSALPPSRATRRP